MEKTILTSKEVIEMTGVTESTLNYWCWQKKIPYYQPTGRKRFFKKEEVERFIFGNKE